MAAGAERHQVVARLREEIRRIERRPARRDGSISCGRDEIDALLPDRGFRRGALTELAGGPASGKTAIALALFAALGPGDLAAYVDGRGELYPPAAAALGVDLARLLVVRPSRTMPDDPSRHPALVILWAAEALLASGAFAVVAVDVPVARAVRGADAAARRLQTAAEKGGAVGLWLAGRGATALRVPAAVRLELSVEDGRIIGRRRHASDEGTWASNASQLRGGIARGSWSPLSREAHEAVPRLRSRASAGPTLGMNGPEPGTSSAGVSFSGSGALRRACECAEQHSDEPARRRQASCAAASRRPEDGDAA